MPAPPSLPAAPLVQLTAANASAFITWFAGIPLSAAQVAINEIALRHTDEAVLDALITLLNGPISGYSRHAVIIATIGQLANTRAAQSLKDFAWRALPNYPSTDGELHAFPMLREKEEALEIAAVHALASLRTTTALDWTLDIAAGHPSAAVRLVAITCYSYYRDDSAAARAALQARVSSDDQKYIDLPRLTETSDPAAVHAAAVAWLGRHPEVVPTETQYGPSVGTLVAEPPPPAGDPTSTSTP